MIKNKLDFKLVNISLLFLIFFFVYQTRDFLLGLLSLVWQIVLPFLIAFAIAYAFYPLVKALCDKKVPKSLAMLIVVGGVLGILGLIIYLVTPLFFSQISSLFSGIISFLREISTEYNLDIGTLQNTLASTFNEALSKIGTYISDGAFSFIGISIDYISKAIIILAASVYFLADMEKIRSSIKKFLMITSKRAYNYLALLDEEMRKYLTGFLKIVLISLIEYTLAYTLIGHPNAILLGFLAALGNLIPYFGGIITNIIAMVTAFVISPVLFIKTCAIFLVFSAVDGYVINPLVYGKSNQIHPLVVIVAVFAGGILAGTLGIIIALPVSIIVIATFKFFKRDIIEMKNKRKVKYHVYKKIR